jgi:hypothetical protein
MDEDETEAETPLTSKSRSEMGVSWRLSPFTLSFMCRTEGSGMT